MKNLILIPARGGSKGIPGKNVKLLNGKPLIQYALEAARGVTNDENICVSTDSKEIKEIVESLGLKVPFIRPDELGSDTASSEAVIKHALKFYADKGKIYDNLVLLQPTSPFRTSKHIQEAIDLMAEGMDMVASVKETDANPYYLLFEEGSNGFLKKSKEGNYNTRQECPKVYELNGAIYVINVASLMEKSIKEFNKVLKYKMNKMESLDIDDPIDWKLAEIIILKNQNFQ